MQLVCTLKGRWANFGSRTDTLGCKHLNCQNWEMKTAGSSAALVRMQRAGLHPRVSDLVVCGQGLRIYIPQSRQVMPVLLMWGPHTILSGCSQAERK